MVNYSLANGWAVVELDGDVDIHTAPMIRDAVIKLLDDGHDHFVLDFDFVTFVDSTGLGLLATIVKRIRQRSGSLRIAAVQGRVHRVFELSGLLDSYQFFPSVEEATQSAPVV